MGEKRTRSSVKKNVDEDVDRIFGPADEMNADASSESPLQVTSMTIVYPEQVFSPVQYNTLRCGGVSMTVTVPPGADPIAIAARAMTELSTIVEEQWQQVSRDFVTRVKR